MQTKKEQYFPIGVRFLNNEFVSKLIETHGPKGIGVYIMILSELRLNKDYKCGMHTLNALARRCKISQMMLNSVLYDFDLFILTREDDAVMVNSPYMDNAMANYDEKIQRNAKGGRMRAQNSKRDSNGQFTSSPGAIEEKRREENKTTTTVVAKEHGNSSSNDDNAGISMHITDATTHQTIKSWEDYLNQAVDDEEWMAVLAMNSGISSMFIRHQAFIVETFRNHIRLQGTGPEIQSAKDIRSYFANFLRPGTLTHKRTISLLLDREEQQQDDPAHRFETIDLETGKRSYHGRPIPDDAPPRPNNTAIWNEDTQKWE